jgi:uncharacterized repeat protein (TIGR01451 family)
MKEKMLLFFLLLTAGNLYGTATTAGSEVINGRDIGTVGEADQPGDMVLKFTQETGLGTETLTATETTVFAVGQIYGLALDDPGDETGAPGEVLWYLYTVENRGNGTDTINLSLSAPLYTGDYGDPWSFQIWNRDRTAQISEIILEKGGEQSFYLRVEIDDGAKNGASGSVEVRGTTTDDGPAYIVRGSVYGGPDVVGDWGTTSVAAAIMRITKSFVYSAPSGYAGSNQYVPGGTITYTLFYKNEGSATATQVSVYDRIPEHTKYVKQSLRMGGADSTYETATEKTDASGDDEASYSNGCAIFNIETVAPGESGKLYFCVTIE